MLSPLSGQNLSYDWGEGSTIPSSKDRLSIMGSSTTDQFHILRTPSDMTDAKIWLDIHNYQDGLVTTHTIDRAIGDYDDNSLLEKELATNNELLLFYRGWNKDKKESSYILRNCHFNEGFKQDGKVLHSYTAKNKMKTGNYFAALSPDKTQFAILSTIPYEKGEKDQYKVLVFDAKSATKLWEKDITIDIIPKRGKATQLVIDNKGQCFVYRRYVVKGEYHYHLTKVDIKGSTDNKIELGEYKIEDAELKLFGDNPILSGFFYGKFAGNSEGSFVVSMNPNSGKISASQFHPFGDRVITSDDKVVRDLQLQDVLFTSDNNILLIGEVLTKNDNSTISNGVKLPSYELISGNIVVIKLTENLAIDWEVIVRKNQRFDAKQSNPSPRWDSFTYGLIDDQLLIFYNHINMRSAWKDENGTLVKQTDFVRTSYPAFMYIVEDNGNVKYGNKLFGLPLYKVYEDILTYARLIPGLAFNNDNAFVIFSTDSLGRLVRPGKVSFSTDE